MGFEQLIEKVHQAEDALESRERAVVAHVRHVKASWRSAWTPGRIVVAGLASGFLVGRARPLRAAGDGGQWLQMITALSGLLASGSAQVAAQSADEAATEASQAAAAAAPEAAIAGATRVSPTSASSPGADPVHPDA
ncbi:hypothetical protein [Aerolutibacter ruishenii]|uniref:Protein sip-5 n=1 Tax=Aerolutibacter ruishenii TaxID=686800 RepID=A0A562M358_9GAMM|nr:hypothetical protein [Lysobacter ruishenii]TWI14376.1 hypothetical protein IP93_00373 [Lysobacter ruishenii]